MARQDRVFARTPAALERRHGIGKNFKRLNKEAKQANEKASEAVEDVTGLAEGWSLDVQNGQVSSKILLTIGGKTVSAVIQFEGVLTDVVLDGYAKEEDLTGFITEDALKNALKGYAKTEDLSEFVSRSNMESYVQDAIDALRQELNPEEPENSGDSGDSGDSGESTDPENTGDPEETPVEE